MSACGTSRHASKPDRREDCVQMPAKMARSDPLPPFGAPTVMAVMRAASLSCQNEEKAQKCTPNLKSSGESRINCRPKCWSTVRSLAAGSTCRSPRRQPPKSRATSPRRPWRCIRRPISRWSANTGPLHIATPRRGHCRASAFRRYKVSGIEALANVFHFNQDVGACGADPEY